MISRADIQRLIQWQPTGHPVLSIFLDLSVNSENKRTHLVFLNQQRGQFRELDSDRASHHREQLGEAFARVERWLDEDFNEANRGVALFVELGGDHFEALQCRAAIPNALFLEDRPVIGPLLKVVERHPRLGILLVDRAHLRLLDTQMGELLHEHEAHGEPYPTPHDVQKGGYSAKDYQKRKAEEVRHFFKEFAQEAAEFQRRYNPDRLALLGTEENVKHFLDFLPQAVRDRIVHTGNAPIDAPVADVLERVADAIADQLEHDSAAAVDRLHDRVRNNHFAVSGLHETLMQLQEGKVETLVLAEDLERSGAQCTRCRFYFPRRDGGCPYCGGETRNGVDLIEVMLRVAQEQEVPVEFVQPAAVADLNGVGALLRF